MARCFIALDLPKEAVNEIRRIQNLLKKRNLFRGKFTEAENLHLTLKFLGEIPISGETENSRNTAEAVNSVEEVKKKLKEVEFSEFSIEFGEAGVFSKSFIRIIWIKLNGKGVFDLQKKIDEKLLGLFEKEERFMSHITIARVKEVYGDKKEFLKYLESIKPKKISFKADRFFLKKSELKPLGPEYSDLGEYCAG